MPHDTPSNNVSQADGVRDSAAEIGRVRHEQPGAIYWAHRANIPPTQQRTATATMMIITTDPSSLSPPALDSADGATVVGAAVVGVGAFFSLGDEVVRAEPCSDGSPCGVVGVTAADTSGVGVDVFGVNVFCFPCAVGTAAAGLPLLGGL